MSSGPTPSVRSLDRMFLGGLAWTAGGKWATQLVTWVSVLVLARLLSPAEFGLVGMAGVYLILTNAIAEFGLAGAVMQMRELGDDVLAQLNTIAVLACVLVFAFCVATSPAVAWFFRVEELSLVVIVNSSAILLTGFQLIPMGMLRRKLDYRRLAAAEATEAFVRAVLTVSFAWMGFSYWSILIGGLTGRAFATAMIYRWYPIPFAVPRWAMVRAPLTFGGQLTVDSFTNTLVSQADGIVVGRILGDALLGSYQMAMTLAKAPAQKITDLLFRVTGPLFASIQADRSLIQRYYLIFVETLTLVVTPLVLGLSLVAPEAVRLVLGEKWMSAAEPIRWLALYGGVQALVSLSSQVLITLRRTRFTMNMSIAMFAVLPVAFVVAAQWGSGGVALCWLLTAPLVLLPYLWVLSKDLSLTMLSLSGAFVPAVVSSAIMLAGIVPLRWWLPSVQLPIVLNLSIVIIAGSLLYGLAVWVLFRKKLSRYLVFFRELRQNRRAAASAMNPNVS